MASGLNRRCVENGPDVTARGQSRARRSIPAWRGRNSSAASPSSSARCSPPTTLRRISLASEPAASDAKG